MERARYVEKLSVQDIHVGERLRRLDSARVSVLATSMDALGLQTPISIVYRNNVTVDDGEPVDGVPCLVAGLHRLEAAKSLGWTQIDAWELEADDVDVRRWEIAENLHRSELSALEHDEHVAEWVRLTDDAISRQVDAKIGRGRPEGGTRAAARELGISEPDARRAKKTAALAPEAKQAARDAKLDDNRSALLKAAAEPTPAGQVEVIRKIATAGSVVAIADPEDVTEREFQALVRVWNKTGLAARNRFIESVLDRPVFDSTRAA